jgi:hypothetical protein
MPRSKPGALPLGDTPNLKDYAFGILPASFLVSILLLWLHIMHTEAYGVSPGATSETEDSHG